MAQPDHVADLLELARDRSLAARQTLVDMIGDLFCERSSVLSERERALMTEILEKLVGGFETDVRRQLADRLADKPAAPPGLLDVLANDEIEVARPVLMRSRVLREADLIAVVRNRTRQHQLAVAMRQEVSAPVADALVGTGDSGVIEALLRNESAQISQATMDYLVEQAQTVDSFQEPLVWRGDLAPALAQRLYWFVSAALRERLLARFDIQPNALDDALEAATQVLTDTVETHPDQPTAAQKLARHIAQTHGIDQALLLKTLRAGEIPLFEALFAELSGIRPPRLQHVLYETGGKGLAIVCKALDIDKATFTPIYLLSRKGESGAQVVNPKALSSVMSFFTRVRMADAQEVLRSWQRDHRYQDALLTLAEDLCVDSGRP
ncbi:DUF2336 domain-containing protein [Rhodovibrio salinarum]|nr:DUF2336 domain-containing protein [Rhodovibrio salinarum]